MTAVPLEIERKFLLTQAPDLTAPELAAATVYEIDQTYLASADGVADRVRKRTRLTDGVVEYFRTVKVRRSALVREEQEQSIDAGTYEQLLEGADPGRAPVRKLRYVFGYAGQTFELDQFTDIAGLYLLEIELDAEDVEVELPPFLAIEREVTEEELYNSKTLGGLLAEGVRSAAELRG